MRAGSLRGDRHRVDDVLDPPHRRRAATPAPRAARTTPFAVNAELLPQGLATDGVLPLEGVPPDGTPVCQRTSGSSRASQVVTGPRSSTPDPAPARSSALADRFR